MGNEQSQQESAEGTSSRIGNGAGGPQSNAMVSHRTGTEEEDVGVASPPDVDLSNLSEEERKMILSVMARAQDLDKDITQRRRSAELVRAESLPNSVTTQIMCPSCHATELTIRTSIKCSKCWKSFCEKCGQCPIVEGKKYSWMCNSCIQQIQCSNKSKVKSQSTREAQENVRRADASGEIMPEKHKKSEKSEEIVGKCHIRSPAKTRRESVEVVVTDDTQPETKPRGVQKSKDGIVRVTRPVTTANGDAAPPHRTQRISRPIQVVAKSEAVVPRKLINVETKVKKQHAEAKSSPEVSPKRIAKVKSPTENVSNKKVHVKAPSVVKVTSSHEPGVAKSKEPIKDESKEISVIATTTTTTTVDTVISSVITTVSQTSPIMDRPIISVDVTVVSRSSTTTNVILTTSSKSGMTNTIANISTVTVTSKSNAANNIRSSTVSILPPQPLESSCKTQLQEKSTSVHATTLPRIKKAEGNKEKAILSQNKTSEEWISNKEENQSFPSKEAEECTDETNQNNLPESRKPEEQIVGTEQGPLRMMKTEKWKTEQEKPIYRSSADEWISSAEQDTLSRRIICDERRSSLDSSIITRGKKREEQITGLEKTTITKTEDWSINSENLSGNHVSEELTKGVELSALSRLNKSKEWTSADISTLSKVKDSEQLAESPIKLIDSSSSVIKAAENRMDSHRIELTSSRDSTNNNGLSSSDQLGTNYQIKPLQDNANQGQNKQKPRTIDLQPQKKVKQKVETADWSPVSDLSPILDVSPSLEAAEQELIEKFRHRSDSEGNANQTSTSSNIPRATSGTISGMLADFNKALGLLDTSPIEDVQKKEKSLSESPPAVSTPVAPVTTESAVYHPVRQQRNQQQPGTPRRTRRLPQPTMEQMQAAVAMAAHGPRDKQSIAMTSVSTGSTSLPVTTSQRPVSPIMPWRTIDSYLMSDADEYDGRTVTLHDISSTVTTSTAESVPITTVAPSQSADITITESSELSPDKSAVSDQSEVSNSLTTLSYSLAQDTEEQLELDSIKLSKLRRKLPSVPSADYGKIPSGTKRSKDRTRTLSTGATPLYTQELLSNGETPLEEVPQSDDTLSKSKLNPQQRSSSADGDYVRNISPTRQAYSPEPAHSFASRKELSVSQGNLSYLRTPSPLLGSESRQITGAGTNLPVYMKTLKQQLRDELKAVTEERKRAQEVRKERDFYLNTEQESYMPQPWQEDTSLQYDTLATHRKLLHTTPAPSTIARRQTSPHTSPRKGRRRHTSDVSLRPFSPIKEDRSSEGDSKPIKTSPIEPEVAKMEELNSLEKSKETTGTEIEQYFQQYSEELAKIRTENGANISTTPPFVSDSWLKNSNSCYLTTERKKQRKEKKSRKPRSWHPSPYVSEDEDEQMTREEKKAKIKAEIARRRQQIEENTRLHEELMKLAKSREKAEQIEYNSSYKMSPTLDTMYRTSHTTTTTSSRTADSMLPGDTTSVLQAIDEILRKETQGVSSVRSSQYFSSPTSSVYSTMPRSRYTPHESSWYQRESSTGTVQFPDNTAEDESIARIASTFPTDSVQSSNILINKPTPLIELETPTDTDPTPAMPLLPDMPSRSRKLLEDLGSSPIGSQAGRSETVQTQYVRQCGDTDKQSHIDTESMTDNALLRQMRKMQRQTVIRTPQKYEFPVKRILLTRDPKDRSVSGNGLGMKVIGGKEIPGGNGLMGAYVAKVCPGGVVETLGEVKEGNQVLEWNGVPLTGKTYEEVQKIISVTADEVEIVIRSDFNMLEPMSSNQSISPRDGISPCSTPSDSLKAGTPGGRTPSPSSLSARKIGSPASTPSSISTPTYNNVTSSHLAAVDKAQTNNREHYRRTTVQTLPRYVGNHFAAHPSMEHRDS
ncbi:uncharacterized protein LOC111622542 isoform X1 [Centruroides sculpturatus]|uniref:uncharacterized protein LOC111622542 isoform X1 n=1 Tax=Centruroides sculpturatus TaxID=218467 RepID=UPI000C6EDF9D|nr:uncharacterized protein LOC111622542 isoform X1 [Centruroides sculpturatus]